MAQKGFSSTTTLVKIQKLGRDLREISSLFYIALVIIYTFTCWYSHKISSALCPGAINDCAGAISCSYNIQKMKITCLSYLLSFSQEKTTYKQGLFFRGSRNLIENCQGFILLGTVAYIKYTLGEQELPGKIEGYPVSPHSYTNGLSVWAWKPLILEEATGRPTQISMELERPLVLAQ